MALTRVNSEGIKDGEVKNADMADDAVGVDELSATGTPGSTTYLRGDNSWTVPPDTTTNTQLSTEEVQDIAGPLVATGGTKTGIAVTYDDANGNMDFVVASQTPEGTAILSTGEGGGSKFLREDGDNSCSWQTVPAGGATINNATENELVTVASTTTQLDAEANLTFDGTTLQVTGDIQGAGNDGTANAMKWDKSDDTLYFRDDYKASFGTGGDLQIYHAGGESYIDEVGAGSILIRSDTHVRINKQSAAESMATFNPDGSVELFYDGVKKFQTEGSNSAARIYGQTIIRSAADNMDIATFTDNGSNRACNLYHDGTKRIATNDQGVDIEVAGSDRGLRIHGSAADKDPYIVFRRKQNDGGNSEPAKIVMTYDSGTTHETGHLDFFTNPDNWAAHLNHRFRIHSNGNLEADDTSISTLSDGRLKRNVTDYTYDLSKFKQIKPRTFDWINPNEHIRDTAVRGFVAQELKDVDDYYINETTPVNTEDKKLITDEKVLTSKLGANDAMYISVINQLIVKIETLETKVAALESA